MIEEKIFTEQVLSGWTVKELEKYYNVSRSVIYNRKKKWGLIGLTPNNKAKIPFEEGNKICTKCGEEKSLEHFFSNGYQPNGKKKYKSTCKICQSKVDRKRKIQTIQEILSELNLVYECFNCGYDKNYAALCFHHVDSSEKDFQLGNFTEYSRDEVFSEIEKCVILCHNCHMEEHYPNMNKIVVDS